MTGRLVARVDDLREFELEGAQKCKEREPAFRDAFTARSGRPFAAWHCVSVLRVTYVLTGVTDWNE